MIITTMAALDPMSLIRGLPGNIAQGLIWGIMALGVYITYRILDFADLTVDGSLATGGAVAIMLIQGGMNPALSLVFAFLAGMAAGFATGILHTALGIPGILASILTQVSLYSVNLGIMGKSNQSVGIAAQNSLVVSSRSLTGSSSYLLFLKLIVGCLVLVAIIYWLFGTELGASIRATGCNPQMARAQGINTNFTKVIALMISNGLVGLCGGVYAQFQGAADVNAGRGAIVIGLAAVIISEVIFGKLCAGKKIAFAYTLAAVFVGAILYFIAYALVMWFGVDSNYMKLFSALVVTCFLAVPYLKGRYMVRRRMAK
ncbi:MAG: ABC transporter permease [Blautia sp.]